MYRKAARVGWVGVKPTHTGCGDCGASNDLTRELGCNLLMLGTLRSVSTGSSQVPQMRHGICDAAPKGSIGNRPKGELLRPGRPVSEALGRSQYSYLRLNLAQVYRLGDIPIKARRDDSFAIAHHGAGRQGNHSEFLKRTLFSQGLNHAESVLQGHLQIQKHHVGSASVDQVECDAAIDCFQYHVAWSFQQ